MVSQYCTECLKFRNQHCKGKEGGKKTVEFFGCKTVVNLSFTKFCKDYEFDKKLMPKPVAVIRIHADSESIDADSTIDFETSPNKGKAKTVKRERVAAKRKRVEEAINVSIADEVDAGENLNSADFDDLLV